MSNTVAKRRIAAYYQVEKDIPVPTSKRVSKWKFSEMEVGNSILVPLEESARLRSAIHAYGVRHGLKFTCHRGEDGVRAWRIE